MIDHQKACKDDTELPDGGVAPEHLAEQQQCLADLREAERDLRQNQSAVGRVDAARKEALKCLFAVGDEETIDAIDIDALDEIETLHREIELNRAKCIEAKSRLELLGPDEPPCDIGELERGLGALRDWLAVDSANGANLSPSDVPLWTLTVLLAGASVVLAMIASPWWGALAVFGGAVAFWVRAKDRQVRMNRRSDCQTRFTQTALQVPDSWTVEAVGRRIQELEKAIVRAHRAVELQAERQSARLQLNQFSSNSGALETKRGELAQRVGVAAGTGSLALMDLATNLREFRRESATLKTAQAAAEASQAERRRLLDKINAFLSSFQFDACDSHDVAKARFNDLKARADKYADADTKLAAALKDDEDTRETLAILESRRQKLFTDVGLIDGDDETLTKRLNQREEYSAATAELRGLETRKSVFDTQLAGADDLLLLSVEELDQIEPELEIRASSRDDILRQIQSIRDRIDAAKSGHDLGDALAERDRAIVAVGEQRDLALQTMAGTFLLDCIENEYRTDSEPRVLRRARDWLARFTRYRYTLQAAGNGEDSEPAFRAVDTTRNRRLGLDELSRGTRMQLLIAVRLAFAAEAEKHRSPLPFILDEVLSSSDPERFKAIIDCLLVLVNEGRQVFYFTCQPGDAKAWLEAAEAAGIADAKLIDLDQERRNVAVAEGSLDEPTTIVREIPSPNGLTLAEYGRRLGAPRLRPSTPAAEAHLAHFLDDTERLYHLAQAGIETVGQLRGLASSGCSDAYVAPDAMEQALARADLLDTFAKGWSVGRGRPLTREALTAAGVTETFIDGVTEMARERNWNAEILMDALEARNDERLKGFRANKIETMRDWMRESGYLPTEETLGEEAIRTRVLKAANQYVRDDKLTADEVRRLFSTWWKICTSDADAI
jgi:hypothetical protein